MLTQIMRPSFAAGEMSPSIWGRTDLNKFHIGCSVLRNCFVSYRGGTMSRAGTALVGQSSQPGTSLPPRIIKFQFNIFQSYILEFADGYLRFITDGGYIIDTLFDITKITNAAQGTVTAPGNDFANGYTVFISGVNSMPRINGRFYVISGLFAGRFDLTDQFGDAVDTRAYGTYSGGGKVGRLVTIASPYAAVDLPYLKFTQSSDVMSITCVNQKTGKEYPPYDLKRLSNTSWTLTQTSFGSAIAAPATCTVTTSNSTSNNPTQYSYVVTAVDAATGQESIASPAGVVSGSVNIAQILGSITVTWARVAGAAFYNIYKAPASTNAIVPIGSVFGYAGTAFGLQWVDNNVTQDFVITPPLHNDPFARGIVLSGTITASGSGYQQGSTTVTINTATGTGGKILPIVVNGQVQALYVQTIGKNYLPADTITIGATAITGAITASAKTAGGAAYVQPYIVVTDTSLAGSGALIGISQVGGVLGDPVVFMAGHTYGGGTTSAAVYDAAGPGAGGTVSVTIGTLAAGTGATATLQVGPQTGTYPSDVAYFQQRRAYAATLNAPDTYFLSQTGAFTNFDAASPPVASDAITGSPWAQQVNGIQWMLPMPGGLIIGTGLDAWQLSGTTGPGSQVEPAQQNAQPQESGGFSPTVPPIKINYDIVYLQALGNIVRDLQYNFFVNIYAGTDIGLFSNHLFENHQIIDWAWAKEPYKVVWAAREDGKFLSLTYMKEQEVAGWSRHDTNGLMMSVATASEPPVDAVYFMVKRYIVGKQRWAYFLERMDNHLWQGPEDAWCVDCGLALDQPEPAATLSAAAAEGPGEINGGYVILGGQNYTAPSAIITDPAGLGQGAEIQFILAGGSIIDFVIENPGHDYTGTQIRIIDATGTGAAIALTVSQNVLFTADAAVFTSANVGDVIRVGGGTATVTSFLSTTQVMASITSRIIKTIPNDPNNMPAPAVSGSWTMTTPVSVVANLDHLEGMEVAILADGSALPQQVVVNGSITLPVPASSIKIGLPYTCQIQSMHTDMQGAGPTVQARRKKVAAVTVRLQGSRGVALGANQSVASTFDFQEEVPWSFMEQIPDRGNRITAGNPIPLFTGDKRVILNDTWTLSDDQPAPGMIAAQQTYPLPMNVLAFVEEIDFGDT